MKVHHPCRKKTKPYFQGPKWYVDNNNGLANGEGSPEEPMRNIQDGIDAAEEGDTVLVLPGTYDRNDDQNLKFEYTSNNSPKHIVLMSRGGPDSTIIDCEGNETAFDIKTMCLGELLLVYSNFRFWSSLRS
jgi:hypothetical protein